MAIDNARDRAPDWAPEASRALREDRDPEAGRRLASLRHIGAAPERAAVPVKLLAVGAAYAVLLWWATKDGG